VVWEGGAERLLPIPIRALQCQPHLTAFYFEKNIVRHEALKRRFCHRTDLISEKGEGMRSIAIAAVMVLSLCSGCARTSIDSKTHGEASLRIERIALIFHSAGTFAPMRSTSGTASTYSDIAVNKAYENQASITQAVRSQFPTVFKAHGISLEVYMDPQDKDRYTLDANKQRHVMHLTPVGANYRFYGGGTNLFMEAQLTELRPVRVLWTGRISVVRPGLAKIDDDWATAFAEKIIAQLQSDKII
jgi:hypothetical protein